MTVMAMEYPGTLSGSCEKLSTPEALARWVKKQWPQKTIDNVKDEWDLTKGEAQGVVYGMASRTTIDKIKHHPRGGWDVMAEVDAMVMGRFEQHMEKRLASIRRARLAAEAEERRSMEILRSLSAARTR